MPALSMFYGIIIYMYREVNTPHHLPHLHAHYGGAKVVVTFDGEVLEGSIPKGKMKLLIAWMEIHKDELEANWELLKAGEGFFKIEPLK